MNLQAVFMCARDYFDSCTVSVTDWLHQATDERDAARRYQSLLHVFSYVAKLDCCGELRQSPRLAYHAGDDSVYFIFKLDNNGDTLLVGEGLPCVRQDEVYSRYDNQGMKTYDHRDQGEKYGNKSTRRQQYESVSVDSSCRAGQ